MSKLPVVFLGGTLCDARLWASVFPQLPDNPIIVPDIRAADSADDMARRLLAELPERFCLCGFSLGAIVALHMMAQAPRRLAGLALISVNPLADRPENAPERYKAVARARRHGMESVIDELWPRYVDPVRFADLTLRQTIVDMAKACGPDVFEQQTNIAINRRDVREKLSLLSAPVLLIGGMSDPICPPERHALLAQACGQARWLSLPRCGHFVPLEAPQATAEALVKWIEESACELTH